MTIIRSLISVTLFISFIVLWFWTWRAEHRERFAEAARLPLEDEPANVESKSS
jgi:cbb3-type cytochrome oxidase subunit 3